MIIYKQIWSMTILPVKDRGRLTLYACATMWHESATEMAQMITSVLTLGGHEYFTNQALHGYNLEAHIFFDEAFDHHGNLNSFCMQLLKILQEVSSSVYGSSYHFVPLLKYRTPYGGRIQWVTKEGNPFVLHLKDSLLVKRRKRWSQVLYMHYLLEWHLEQKGNTEALLLTLDGDVEFSPSAVVHLLNSLQDDKTASAVCGRTHPLGSGIMYWMQRFEYAIAHWCVKTTEDVLGSVLCAPGCFSMFKASSLVKSGILEKFRKESTTAVEAIQCEQGEDRWLCTMLMKEGHKVTFNPCAHVYTHTPLTLTDFYHQRLRWTPTFVPNTLGVLGVLANSRGARALGTRRELLRKLVNLPFYLYVLFSVLMGLFDPGIVVFMNSQLWSILTGHESDVVFKLSILIPLMYTIVCLFASDDIQMKVVKVLTLISSALQIFFLALICQYAILSYFEAEGWENELFVVGVTAVIIGLLQWGEWSDIPFGIVYVIIIPSVQIFKTIYVICNFSNMAWGTRENTQISKTHANCQNGLDVQNNSPCNAMTNDWTEDIPGLQLGQIPADEKLYLERLRTSYLLPKEKRDTLLHDRLKKLRNTVIVAMVSINAVFAYCCYNIKIYILEYEVSFARCAQVIVYIMMMTQFCCIVIHRMRTCLYYLRHKKKHIEETVICNNNAEIKVVAL